MEEIEHLIISDLGLLNWIEGFIVDRKSRGLAPKTISFYKERLQKFYNYCIARTTRIEEIDAVFIREYIVHLEEHHSAGGVHANFRALRAFFSWYAEETEEPNPIKKVKVKPPRIPPLEPVNIDDVKKMIAICPNTFTGIRDRLIFYLLLDTGVRKSELLNMNVEDINPITGAIRVFGKGKYRVVFIGRKTRQLLRKYLRISGIGEGALIQIAEHKFSNAIGERLSPNGLMQVLKRRAEQANVKRPALHSFRRYFALTMLRNGVDVFSLQILMGHSDLQVLRRYLKQTEHDTQKAHMLGSPVDSF